MDYPMGFARRFLEQAASYGHAWANVDLESGEIDYVEDPRDTADDDVDTSSARILVVDEDVELAWDDLVREAIAFYPKSTVEEGAFAILSVIIEEFLITNDAPSPRYFTIREIFRMP